MDFSSYKLQHGGKLILIQFPNGNTYNCRHITYKEYLVFKSLYDSFTVPSARIDELIAKTVILDPIFQNDEWLNAQYAGLCRSIANLVMFLGGNHYDHNDLETFHQMLNSARSEAGLVDNVIFSTVCHVYPAYKFSDLTELTYAEVLRLFANAEKFLLDTGQITEPLRFGTDVEGAAPVRGDSNVKQDSQGRMVVSTDEMQASGFLLGGDMEAVQAHDRSINKMVEQRAKEQKKTYFNSPEGQRLIHEKNKRLAQEMRRKKQGGSGKNQRSSVSVRKKK